MRFHDSFSRGNFRERLLENQKDFLRVKVPEVGHITTASDRFQPMLICEEATLVGKRQGNREIAAW